MSSPLIIRRTFAVLAALAFLGVPILSAQTPFSLFDDFEDDTLETRPTASWYTIGAFSGGTNCDQIVGNSGTQAVVCDHRGIVSPFGPTDFGPSPGLDGTSQGVWIYRNGGSAGLQFNVNDPQKFETISFWRDGARMEFGASTTPVVFGGATFADIFVIQQAGGGDWTGGPTGCGSPSRVQLDLDWTTGQMLHSCYDATDTFVDSVTRSFPTGNPITYFGIRNVLAINSDIAFDQFSLDGTIPPNPQPPEGLSAVVVEPKATDSPSDEGTVELRWPVSPDDPDQNQGTFQYDVYQDGINVATDPTTGADGDGTRFHQLFIVGNLAGSPTTYAIKAVNTTSGLESVFSCSVNVDTSVLGDTDTCGNPFPGSGVGGGGLAHTTPTDTAAGTSGFCADMMGDSDGSLFLCGLILVVVAFLAVAGAFASFVNRNGTGLPAAIAGTIGGFGMMVFNVFAGIWGLVWGVVLIMLTAATIVGLLRKTFVGRGGDDG